MFSVPPPLVHVAVSGGALTPIAEDSLRPTALVALTLHATALPAVSPVTTSGELVPVTLCEPQVAV